MFNRLIRKENKELMRHSRNYLSGSLVQYLLVAATIPIFTRLLLPSGYGVLSIFNSLLTLLPIIFGLNFRGGIGRYYLDNEKNDFEAALGSNLLFIISFSIVVLILLMIFKTRISLFLNIDEKVFVYAAIISCTMVSLEIYLRYLNGSQQSSVYSILSVVRSGLILFSSIGLMLLMKENRYFGKIYGEFVVTLLLSGYSLYMLVKIAKFSFDWKHVKYTLRFSIPLIPHAMSMFILGYFDRIIINQLSTKLNTGIYSFAYDVGMAMNVIVMATTKAWHPIFFQEYNERNTDKINRMVKGYAKKIYFAAVIIILFSSEVIHILADSQYYHAIGIVPVIVMGYVFVFLYTLYFQYASYRKRTELISLNTFIAGFVNIGLNYWLIPIFGYEVAAHTTLFSYILLFSLHFINAKYILKEKTIPLMVLLPHLFILFAIAAIYMYGLVKINHWYFQLPVKFIITAVSFYIFIYSDTPEEVLN
ncbi:MAG: oligosaccharide flippase family protein [Deltaproteobacteria bacterium]|nr:oligosaccharide flippase family protein [Deltaproteobacteria bacterium]